MIVYLCMVAWGGYYGELREAEEEEEEAVRRRRPGGGGAWWSGGRVTWAGGGGRGVPPPPSLWQGVFFFFSAVSQWLFIIINSVCLRTRVNHQNDGTIGGNAKQQHGGGGGDIRRRSKTNNKGKQKNEKTCQKNTLYQGLAAGGDAALASCRRAFTFFQTALFASLHRE